MQANRAGHPGGYRTCVPAEQDSEAGAQMEGGEYTGDRRGSRTEADGSDDQDRLDLPGREGIVAVAPAVGA